MYKKAMSGEPMSNSSSSSSPSAPRSISIGDLTAMPGEKVSGLVRIFPNNNDNNEDDNDDDDDVAAIPITIVNGSGKGGSPTTLVVLAGIHGSEYTPIVATQRLANDLDPTTLIGGGSVILIHAANLPSYLGRTVYYSPIDGKNLNRSFPGNATGTVTERIAYFLEEHVYKPYADAVMDMHSGDANEQLSPSYTAYYGKAKSPELVQKSRDMAYAFGVSNLIVEFQWQLEGKQNDTSSSALSPASPGAVWAGSAAMALGIPSIDVEMAHGMGIYDPISIDHAYRGVLRVMQHLNILPASPLLLGTTMTTIPDDNTLEPCLVTDRIFIEAPLRGSWVPLIDAGTFVTEGTMIGYTTDLFGRERTFKVLAPSDGLVLFRFEAPPVLRGDTLAVLAILNSDSDSSCARLQHDHSYLVGSSSAAVECSSSFLWQILAVTGWLVVVLLKIMAMTRRTRLLSKNQASHITIPQNEEELTEDDDDNPIV